MSDLPPGFKLDPVSELPSGFTLDEQKPRTLEDRAKDTLEVAADQLSFGLLPKLAAKVKQLRGVGTYDENLKENQRQVEEASKRIGTAGTIGAGVLGGALTGGALADAGITLLGNLGRGAGIGTRLAAGAAEGAGYGAADAAGHSKADTWGGVAGDAAKGAGVGAVTGGVLTGAAAALPRIITPFVNSDPERARLAAVLEANGVKPTAAQSTGSPMLNWMENAAGKAPMGFMPKGATKQGEGVAQAVARESGVAPGQITPHALDTAMDAVGSEIGNIQRTYPLQYDNQFIQELVNIAQDADVLGKSHRGQINAFINRILKPGAAMDPQAMQALRTDLRLAVEKGPNGTPLFNRAVTRMRDAMDDALERTITASGNPADVAALNAARQKYANLNTLMDALSRSGGKGDLGSVTPTALAQALKSGMGKTAYVTGKGDLNDLARASSALLPTKEGSGTAERNLFYHIIGAPITLGVGPAASSLINSRLAQAYLRNQAVTGTLTPNSAAIAGLLEGVQGNKRRGLLDR